MKKFKLLFALIFLCHGYLFSQNQDQTRELDDILAASKKAGLEASVSNTIPVKIPFEKAIEFPGQACFHPVRYVYALAEQFQQAYWR